MFVRSLSESHPVLETLAAAVTVWVVEALVAIAPACLPRIQEIAIDGQVLAFTAVVTLLTAIVFGTLPAVQDSRADVNDALKEGARGASSGRGVLRSALVVVESALALGTCLRTGASRIEPMVALGR